MPCRTKQKDFLVLVGYAESLNWISRSLETAPNVLSSSEGPPPCVLFSCSSSEPPLICVMNGGAPFDQMTVVERG